MRSSEKPPKKPAPSSQMSIPTPTPLPMSDLQTLSLADVPLLRFISLAPGIGSALLGILMLGVGQLCEVVLRVEKASREKDA